MSLKQNASQCTIPKTSDNIYINEAVEIKRVNMKDDRYTEKYKKLTNKQSSGTKQTTIDAQARDWFRSLSAEERSGATRFSDRAFLGTFLALSSPWLTSTTSKATGTTTNTTNDNHVTRSDTSTPWDTMVSLDEFRRKYQEVESSLNATPKLANRKSSTSLDFNTTGSPITLVDENRASSDDDRGGVEFDEFRIQRLQEYETSFVRAMNEHPTKSIPTLTPLQQLLEEVAIILPSVFRNITGSYEPNPHLIIRPSYFDSVSDEEQLLILSTHASDDNHLFLSFANDKNMTNEDSSLGWLRRINSDNDSRSTSISLSTLMLARFEWAAWESFLQFEYQNDNGKGETLVEVDAQPKSHLLSILGDVLSHCLAINDRSLTIDSATLESFVAPLVKTCFTEYPDADPVKVDDVQHVILTPLSWVWFASQRHSPLSYDVLEEMDKAVEASIEKMESDKEMSGTSDSNTSDNITSGDQQRKKKKKNKKKKNKKSVSISIESVNTAANNTSCENVNADIAIATEEIPNQIDRSDDALYALTNVVAAESIDTESVDSDDTPDDVMLPQLMTKSTHERTEDIDVSRQDGKIIIASALNTSFSKNSSSEESTVENTTNSTELDTWATVEVRGRNSRKKPAPPTPPSPITKPSTPSITIATMASDTQRSIVNKKSKIAKSNGTQKKKGVAQKIVVDILTSVIDSIDDESRKMKQLRITTPPRPVNSWKNGPPGVLQKTAAGIRMEAPMRDKLLGRNVDTISLTNENASGSSKRVDELKTLNKSHVNDISKNVVDKTNIRTDQNTAPTYQDTSSSSSNAVLGSKEPQNTLDRKSDSSSSDTEEVPQNDGCEIASKLDTIVASTPPLPTLLSPANANSANSSVASSLEAPPRGRTHHHSDAVKDVNDVGYHLLDVCDRLSRDMSLFMSRRALALNARRRERGAILSALQSSVASIWPGMCHVELYGSCATQLDLPSSDIDVVVLGLHRKPYISTQIKSDARSSSTDNITEESYLIDDIHHQMLQLIPSASYGMLPQHRNAEQVVKLAADLEKQPWAVQVNAIPTASVPVIKVLADPSKLNGTSSGNDWLTQRQQMAGEAATAAGGVVAFDNRPNPEYSKADSGSYPPPTHVPWRGSDVMKGLLSLDITFEGPEHGGIGSTEFSTRTVAESCEESGLHPDATPFVQTLMVLKELLAQRKLNEPYSGGLSSYALLLLVLALVRERAVIREEIELVEQQRRAMTVGELNSFPSGSITAYDSDHFSLLQPTLSETKYTDGAEEVILSPANQKANNLDDKSDYVNPRDVSSTKQAQSKSFAQSNVKASSWAMIAKMNPGPKSPLVTTKNVDDATMEKDKISTEIEDRDKQPTVEKSGQKPTFADAVAGSRSTTRVAQVRQNSNKNAISMEKTSHDVKYESKVMRSETTTSACNSAPKQASNVTSTVSPIDPKTRAPAFYPQGYNDIVEVLCSGETTAGKLLMHFLLYYGQHFDAQSTAIDISGKHERHYDDQTPPNSYLSPYIQRQSLGNIDPITGMLTVDPIVIYDPLEGAENNNVSRRCFAWNSVRWIFAQSYATLASAVERSATPPTSPNGGAMPQAIVRDGDSETFSFSPDTNCDLMDPSSPLLRCLLSF